MACLSVAPPPPPHPTKQDSRPLIYTRMPGSIIHAATEPAHRRIYPFFSESRSYKSTEVKWYGKISEAGKVKRFLVNVYEDWNGTAKLVRPEKSKDFW